MVRKSIIIFFFILLFIPQFAPCSDITEQTPWGSIDWSNYTAESIGENSTIPLLYDQKLNRGASLRLARSKSFKNLYQLILHIPIIEDKLLIDLLNENQKQILIKKTYEEACVLGWMNILKDKVEVTVRVNILETVSKFINSYFNKEKGNNSNVYIIDLRNFNVLPSLVCRIYDQKDSLIYSSSPKYVTSMEDAITYAGPRNVFLLKVNKIKHKRCSLIVTSETNNLQNVVLVLGDKKYDETGKNTD